MFNLFSKLNIQDAPFIPYLNTGTQYDLLTGRFVPGLHGSTILNGGLTSTNAVQGKPQVFKSTINNALIINAMARYPGTYFIIYDSEDSIKEKRRLSRMSDLYLDDPVKREAHLKDLESRIVILNITTHNLETLFDVIRNASDEKQKNIKELLVECPIIDPGTGLPAQMITPTFISIDSLSGAKSKITKEMLDKSDASSSETNMLYMRDGKVKRMIIDQLPEMAAKAGLYVSLTAHVGDKVQMNPFAPEAKDMQYQKQGEKTKGVGSSFNFLISCMVELRSARVLQKDKECEYALESKLTNPFEMSSVEMIMIRNKNAQSGTKFTPVVSQTNGYEAGLTNYHYLRESGYFGLGGTAVNVRPMLTPDAVTGRTRIATDVKSNYKLARGLEILSQLCFIQNNWSIHDRTVPYDITPEKLYEGLHKSTYAMDDILNSRGWWTYDKNAERDYFSLFDILAITNGSYKPKLIPVKA